MEERKLTKEDIDRVRGIEGFPIAKDEDIIALSRPPYYTACPNPFIADFIKEHGTPYDEATDDYHCEPFAADVSEGKSDPIYNAHSYHTKVPYKAIMRYILHYTKPGDVVLDGFCGTGMTGVAAQMCGCPDDSFRIQIESETPFVKWGARYSILNDLSPAAAFIAFNYNAPADKYKFKNDAEAILSECEEEYGWMYETQHCQLGKKICGINGTPLVGRINYVVWSDVFLCPNCTKEMVYWDVGVGRGSGEELKEFCCPHCGCVIQKRTAERSMETIYDNALDKQVTVAKTVPVLINYSISGKRFEKEPDVQDMETLKKIQEIRFQQSSKNAELPFGYNTEQPKRSHGVQYTSQIYTARNYAILSALELRIRKSNNTHLYTLITSVANRNLMRCNRFVINSYNPRGRVNGPMPGTLFIASLTVEQNPFELIKYKVDDLLNMYTQDFNCENVCISTQSTIKYNGVADNSIDYIFTDPPFGGNINYSEMNFINETWLGVTTQPATEAVVNSAIHKSQSDYEELMLSCFREYYRILKPNRWITVEFHNSQNSIWNIIQNAIQNSGFIIADVHVLDKKRESLAQLVTPDAVKKDLVITAYKPNQSFTAQFVAQMGNDVEMAWEFTRQQLMHLPIAPSSEEKLDYVPGRYEFLLFDRMVAFHIMNGIPVPMDAHTFYAGLRERFIQRDGMFFLADQVNEYDERRQKMELQDQQTSLSVYDEKSAILWLNVQLIQSRKSRSEIQQSFLKNWHQSKFEQMPELLDMLKENFLQDADGKWYVPNLSDKADLEKLRRKRLLKDFYDIYAKGTGRIKNARTEAIRVGFDECWKERNYSLIVKVGDRLPETVLQEDPALLMYYDNAASRM